MSIILQTGEPATFEAEFTKSGIGYAPAAVTATLLAPDNTITAIGNGSLVVLSAAGVAGICKFTTTPDPTKPGGWTCVFHANETGVDQDDRKSLIFVGVGGVNIRESNRAADIVGTA